MVKPLIALLHVYLHVCFYYCSFKESQNYIRKQEIIDNLHASTKRLHSLFSDCIPWWRSSSVLFFF